MDHLFAKMQSDLTERLLRPYTMAPPRPTPPSTPLADLLRTLDALTPQMRIEQWCVVEMVPGRWEPVTGWLKEAEWTVQLQALTPYKLYRMVNKQTRRLMELIPTPTGQMLQRTDGRSWLDPPDWHWEPPRGDPPSLTMRIDPRWGLGV